MEIQEIRQSVKEQLLVNRYEHTLGVEETSTILANRYGADEKKAKISALLHDIAKNQTYNELREQLILAGESSYLEYSDLVWHAPVGALVARANYQIQDEDILNAIKYHSTGRPAMSLLEQIIFLADYIEPGRTQPNVNQIRELAVHSLEKAVAQTLANTVTYLSSKGEKDIHPDTLAAYEFYRHYL